MYIVLGVLLVELISGANSICFMRSQEIRILAYCFIRTMKENRHDESIDDLINWRKVRLPQNSQENVELTTFLTPDQVVNPQFVTIM